MHIVHISYETARRVTLDGIKPAPLDAIQCPSPPLGDRSRITPAPQCKECSSKMYEAKSSKMYEAKSNKMYEAKSSKMYEAKPSAIHTRDNSWAGLLKSSTR